MITRILDPLIPLITVPDRLGVSAGPALVSGVPERAHPRSQEPSYQRFGEELGRMAPANVPARAHRSDLDFDIPLQFGGAHGCEVFH